jgi:hypothetical protein
MNTDDFLEVFMAVASMIDLSRDTFHTWIYGETAVIKIDTPFQFRTESLDIPLVMTILINIRQYGQTVRFNVKFRAYQVQIDQHGNCHNIPHYMHPDLSSYSFAELRFNSLLELLCFMKRRFQGGNLVKIR